MRGARGRAGGYRLDGRPLSDVNLSDGAGLYTSKQT